MATTSVALPGQLLGPANKYRPGPGVHLHDANLYSSLLGAVTISQPASAALASNNNNIAVPRGPAKRPNKLSAAIQSAAGPGPGGNKADAELPTVSVSRQAARRQREVLPQVGNAVLCRVTRINPRQAVAAILVCGDTVLEAEWQGVIRVQDVRATEKDRVKIYESFRPGDIVRASVVRIHPHLYTSLIFPWRHWCSSRRQRGKGQDRCADQEPCACVFVCRSRSATRPTTTCPRRVMTLG